MTLLLCRWLVFCGQGPLSVVIVWGSVAGLSSYSVSLCGAITQPSPNNSSAAASQQLHERGHTIVRHKGTERQRAVASVMAADPWDVFGSDSDGDQSAAPVSSEAKSGAIPLRFACSQASKPAFSSTHKLVHTMTLDGIGLMAGNLPLVSPTGYWPQCNAWRAHASRHTYFPSACPCLALTPQTTAAVHDSPVGVSGYSLLQYKSLITTMR